MLLLMTICFLSDPSVCREERLSLSFEETGYSACMVHAQWKLAEWQQSHPGWRIDRWRCVSRAAVPTKT